MPHAGSFGAKGAIAARHSKSVSWFDEVKEQRGREGDNKRGADYCPSPLVERIRDGIFENVQPQAKKG